MTVGIGHANRGRALELAVEHANACYLNQQIDQIQKVATPTKVVADRRRDKTKVIREKSTVDFVGAWAGRPIAFDAKENREMTNFPLRNVHDHQVAFLANWEAVGGVGFLLVFQASDQAVYLLPYDQLEAYLGRQAMGGRASITVEELRQLPRVRPGRGCTLDYLAALDRWLRTRTA